MALHQIDGLAVTTIAEFYENDDHDSVSSLGFVVGDVVREGLGIRQLQAERRDCLEPPRDPQASCLPRSEASTTNQTSIIVLQTCDIVETCRRPQLVKISLHNL